MYHRRRSSSIGSVGSPTLLQLQSTDSIGSMRPSLAWLFNHIRREDEKNLTKSDLSKLLGSQVNSSQLDQAFANLDTDGDGEISMEEFIAGVARFWKEAPNTPSVGSDLPLFCFPSTNSIPLPQPSMCPEEYYEYEGDECLSDGIRPSPSTHFQSMLSALSSHNRHSMEHLWVALQDANPELLGDFEDFVSEVASEVEGAQRALDKQRRATKREAVELDDEIESRLNAAQTTLHIQTHLVRQEEKAKLEKSLVAKESELLSVRNQLQEHGRRRSSLSGAEKKPFNKLESEIMQTHQSHYELEQQCEDLSKEKEELQERLEVSERMLQEKHSTSEFLSMEELKLQQQEQSHQEEELLRQKKAYEEQIDSLRKQLELYSNRSEDGNGLMAQPDLVATTRPNRSLASSPFLRRGMRCNRSARVVMEKRPHFPPAVPPLSVKGVMHGSLGRSLSLPNLVDVDDLEGGLDSSTSNRNTILVMPDSEAIYEDRPLRPGGSSVSSSADNVSGSIVQSESESEGKELTRLQKEPLEFLASFSGRPDYVFKILVIGNSYVGKSSYLMRLCNSSFSQRYSSTIGVDFYHKSLLVEDKVISLQLWDTAGQERFQSVSKAYYRGAQGVILMYDIGQEESFIAIKSWINSIKDNIDEPPAALILVGNKQDLETSAEREVSTETGETFAKIYGAEFTETSAKTGYNVKDTLLKLVRSMKHYYEDDSSRLVSLKASRGDVTKLGSKMESKCCSRT